MSNVVGADVIQARSCCVRAHQIVDRSYGQPSTVVPGLVAPEGWPVVNPTLGPRLHIDAHGAGPGVLIGEQCVPCDPCLYFPRISRSKLGRRCF